MMISPEYLAEQWAKLSFSELISERDNIIRFMQDFEKKEMAGDRSDPEWRCSPSPAVRYQVYFDYLEMLCDLMHEKYNSEYVLGKRTLNQDAEEGECSSNK